MKKKNPTYIRFTV